MLNLKSLTDGQSFIYIISRVFDISEKLKAEDIEKCVLDGVHRAFEKAGFAPSGAAAFTFVPFRDTVQKDPEAVTETNTERNLTREIYSADLKRLDKLFAMVGFFDGLSKDEGICWEIGYAFGLGRPIILALTDFIRADFKGVPGTEHLLDPVLEAMASRVVYRYQIPQSGGTYRQQLQAVLSKIYTQVEEEIYTLGLAMTEESDTGIPNRESTEQHDVYIDFGGGLFEWQSELQNDLADRLRAMKLSCTVANRYSYYKSKGFMPITVKELGLREIRKAESAKIVITCGDSLEMSSGTAAIQGYARAIDKHIILYDSKATNIVGDSEYKSSRNLMIDHSADRSIARFSDIPGAVEELLSCSMVK